MSQKAKRKIARPRRPRANGNGNSVFMSMFTDIALAMILIILYTFSPGKHNSSNALESSEDVTMEPNPRVTRQTAMKIKSAIVYVTGKGMRYEGKEYENSNGLIAMLKQKGVSKVIVVPGEKNEQRLFRHLMKENFDVGIGYVEK